MNTEDKNKVVVWTERLEAMSDQLHALAAEILDGRITSAQLYSLRYPLEALHEVVDSVFAGSSYVDPPDGADPQDDLEIYLKHVQDREEARERKYDEQKEGGG